MNKAVSTQAFVSPNRWVDWALELNSLWGDLKHELTKAEIVYKREMFKLQEENEKLSTSKAEIQVQARELQEGEKMTVYEKYKYLEGRDKIVKEFILLAKRRSKIEQTFEY